VKAERSRIRRSKMQQPITFHSDLLKRVRKTTFVGRSKELWGGKICKISGEKEEITLSLHVFLGGREREVIGGKGV